MIQPEQHVARAVESKPEPIMTSPVVPLSEAELLIVERTATVQRPVHWVYVARLVAEVRRHRRGESGTGPDARSAGAPPWTAGEPQR